MKNFWYIFGWEKSRVAVFKNIWSIINRLVPINGLIKSCDLKTCHKKNKKKNRKIFYDKIERALVSNHINKEPALMELHTRELFELKDVIVLFVF